MGDCYTKLQWTQSRFWKAKELQSNRPCRNAVTGGKCQFSKFSVRPRSNVLNILTEQHWTFVQQSWVLFSDVQLLGGQTCWKFCWTRLNLVLTITHCASANWTNVQWLVKRTEQHSTSRKTKEMLSRSTFVQWKVWSRSNFTEQDSTRVNKAQQGGQTLWTFCTQQIFSVVQWNVQYV